MDEHINYEFRKLRVGDIIDGTVINVKPNVIMLDINYTTEGTMYIDQYSDQRLETFNGIVKPGDTVTAVVRKITQESDHGMAVYLSRIPLLKQESYEKVKEAFKANESIAARVVRDVNRGLVLSYQGHDLFLPESQIGLEQDEEKASLVGKKIDVRIIDIDEKKRRIVCSRKVLRREQVVEARESELETIKTGDVLKGTVASLKPFGAFVKFDHVQGFLRLSQIAHERIDSVEDVLKIGDEVEVKVIKKEGHKIDLSRKILLATPYDKFISEYKVGSTVFGVVNQKLPFGLILTLTDGVSGLLHKNEFSWNPNDNFANTVNFEDEVEVSVIGIDPKKKKISLSRKFLEDNPWAKVTAKKYDVVPVKIIEIMAGKGVNVEVQGVETFIPVQELSNERISKIEDHFNIGDVYDAKVIDINPAEWSIKVSIAKREADIERAQFEQYMTEEETEEAVTLGDLFEDVLKKDDSQ